MAARENQGYLIAVIILVLLSLVLALVSFLGIQKAYEQADAAQAAETKLEVSRSLSKAEELKGEAFKAMIGGLGTAPAELDKVRNDIQQISLNQNLGEADKKYLKDILDEVTTARDIYKDETAGVIFNQGGDAAIATLRSRITDLTSLVDKMRNEITIQLRETEEAARDAKAKIAVAEATAEEAEKARVLAVKNLNEEKAASLVKENKLKGEIEEFKNTISSVTEQSNEAAERDAQLIKAGKNQIALLENDNVILKTKLNKLTNEVYDHADGQVVRVASELNMVFIDRGQNDGLTNNRTFAIYDKSVTNFETAVSKGSIEVVKVNPFGSEARITSENPTNPILRGDHILTPTWDPGFSIKIAIAGRFDLDGDRFDDTEKLIRLIERNGGQVVAQHDEKGVISGEISPEIRYLVKGNKELIGSIDDPDAGRILTAQIELEEEAEKNTVQIIGLQKLLNLLGVAAQAKTKQLDFAPGDFVPREPGELRGSESLSR